MLVHYVKEERGKRAGNLKGVVVAVPSADSKFKIGWSYCSKRDNFSRERAFEIALGRCENPSGPHTIMPQAVKRVFEKMSARAQRYYK